MRPHAVPPEPKQDIALCLNTRNRIRSGDAVADANTADVTLSLRDLLPSTRMHYISVVSVEAPRAQLTIEQPANRIYYSHGYLFDAVTTEQLVDRTFVVQERREGTCRAGTCGRTLAAVVPLETNSIVSIIPAGILGRAIYVTMFPHALDVIGAYDWGAFITINTTAAPNAPVVVSLTSGLLTLFRDDPCMFEAPFEQGAIANMAVLRSPTIPTPQDLASVVTAALRVATENEGGDFARPGPHGCLHPCPVYSVVYGPPRGGTTGRHNERGVCSDGTGGPPTYLFTLQATCAVPVGTCVQGQGKLTAVLGFGSGNLGTRYENARATLLEGTWPPPPLPSIALPPGNYDMQSLAGAISREFNRFYLPRDAASAHAIYISTGGLGAQMIDLTPLAGQPEVFTADEYAQHVTSRIASAVPPVLQIAVRWIPPPDGCSTDTGYFLFEGPLLSVPGEPQGYPKYSLVFSHPLSTAHGTLGFLPLDQTGWNTYQSTEAIRWSPQHYPLPATAVPGSPAPASANLGYIVQVAVKGATGGICAAAARPTGEANPPPTPGGGVLNLYLGASAYEGTPLAIAADVLGFEPAPQTWAQNAGPLTSTMPVALGGPAYLLVEITTGATEQTYVHHASMKGDRAPTRIVAKIVLGNHGIRMERYYPMTLELAKGARANTIRVRLLTPDHELYRLHGRDWSLTLLVGSALPDTNLGFAWA